MLGFYRTKLKISLIVLEDSQTHVVQTGQDELGHVGLLLD